MLHTPAGSCACKMDDLPSPSQPAWPSRPMKDKTFRQSRPGGLQRSLPAAASGTAQICVKGTFLHVVDTVGDDLEPLSPTSLSDPGSEISDHSKHTQHQTMEILNRRMADMWCRASRSDGASECSTHADEAACSVEPQQQHLRQSVVGHSSATDSPTSRSNLRTWQGIAEDVHEALLRHQVEFQDQSHNTSAATVQQSLHQPMQPQCPLGGHVIFNHKPDEQHPHQTSSLNHGLVNQSFGYMQRASHLPSQSWQANACRLNMLPELAASSHFANQMPWMGAAAAAHRPSDITSSISAKQQCDDVVSALAVIPEQVRLLLESTAQGVAHEVCGEVAAMGDVIRYNSSSFNKDAEIAVEKLECIPSLILNSFEGKLMRVKDKVRRKVNNVIEDLDHSALFKEEVVKKLYTIPEEVVNITAEAMEEVSHDPR